MRPSPTMRKRSEWEIVPLSASSSDPCGVSGQSGRSTPPGASIDSVRLTGLQLREKPLWSASMLIPERLRMGRHQKPVHVQPHEASRSSTRFHVAKIHSTHQVRRGGWRLKLKGTQCLLPVDLWSTLSVFSPACSLHQLLLSWGRHQAFARAISFWQKSHPSFPSWTWWFGLIWEQHGWVSADQLCAICSSIGKFYGAQTSLC